MINWFRFTCMQIILRIEELKGSFWHYRFWKYKGNIRNKRHSLKNPTRSPCNYETHWLEQNSRTRRPKWRQRMTLSVCRVCSVGTEKSGMYWISNTCNHVKGLKQSPVSRTCNSLYLRYKCHRIDRVKAFENA